MYVIYNRGRAIMISLIHPSWGRPKQSRYNVDNWLNKSGHTDVEVIVSIDRNDQHLNGYEMFYQSLHHRAAGSLGLSCSFGINNYDSYESDNFKLICGINNSVVEATNRAAKIAKGDILIYLSDDFDCPENWGPLVLKEFEGVEGPCLLKVDDCLQAFHAPVLTIPIMNRALYERLGYFWHPEYKSMFVDTDLFEVCKKNNWIKNAPHLKFPHNHVSVGKAQDDETYRRSAANWDQGKAVFARRKAQGFPV